MGNLLPERVIPARPFQRYGVDFFDPIYINFKIKEKRPTKE